MKEIRFTQMVSVGCGIDIRQSHVAASIRKSDKEVETREFETYTSSLTSLREWCKTEEVTHVVMASIGIYWKPVFNVLEEDFEVILVNARHVRNRIIRVLEDANIKLSSVLSDVDDAVGKKVVNDLINGETSVEQLVRHYHGKQKVSKAELGKISLKHVFGIVDD